MNAKSLLGKFGGLFQYVTLFETQKPLIWRSGAFLIERYFSDTLLAVLCI